MKRIFLNLLCLLFPYIAGAQGIDSLKSANIAQVTIVANRIPSPLKQNPGAVSLAGNEILSTMPRSIAVDEALRLVPGVRIDNQANGARVHMSIRGQGILSERGLRGINVLIDGVPVNDPSGFAPDLYDVDWLAVDRVEVLRGPSASLYGGGSNAGVLNIITQNGGEKPLNGTFSATGGSNGFYKLFAQAGGSLKNLDYRVTASRSSGYGYRQHTAFWSDLLNEKVNLRISEKFKLTQILQFTGYFNQNAEGLSLDQLSDPKQANPDAIPFNEYQKTGRVTNAVVAEFKPTANQSLKLTAFMRLTNYKEPGSSDVDYRLSHAPGVNLAYMLDAGHGPAKNHLVAGIDLQWQTIDEYKLPNIRVSGRTEKIGEMSETVVEDTFLLANQTISQRNAGLFLVDRMELGQKLNLIASLRYDDIYNRLDDKMNHPDNLSGVASFNKITSRVGISYAVASLVNLYANWGQGFLPPATEELASNPVAFGGFNRNLTAATSAGEEIGVRGSRSDVLYYDITGFILNTKNDFYRYRILPARPLETFYGNAGSSKRYGLETYLRYAPAQKLILQVSYTYSHFTYTSPDSIKGDWLPNCPQHQIYAELDYHPFKNLSLEIGSEYQSRWYIYTDKMNSNTSQAGFKMFHASIAYRFVLAGTHAELSLYGKNLFNTRYIAFTEPDPDGNSYQPGSGREFFCSLRLAI